MKHARLAGLIAAALALGALLTGCPNGGEEPGTEADIASFIFEAANNDALDADVEATIGTDGAVAATVPDGTDVTALVPTVTIPAGATVAPESGVAQDFSDPVSYTVTAEDGETSAEFTVTVTAAPADPDSPTDPDASTACDITGFVFAAADNAELSSDVTATVGTGTVSAEVPFGTDRSALVPTITVSDAATVDPASGVAQDFSSDVTYTVTAEDTTTTQEYVVTVGQTDAVIVGGNVFQALSLDKDVITAAGMHGFARSYDGTGVGALMNEPTMGVAVGDYIYFSDSDNYRIRRFDPSTNSVTTISGDGTYGYNEGTAENAQFRNPRGLAYDGTDLYVADTDSHAIRRVSLSDGSTELVAGNPGTAGFNDATGGSAQFDSPRDLCYHDGYLYVADDSNHRVRRVDVSTQEVTTLAGSGTQTHTNGTGASAQFDGVDGIAFDGTDLWVVSNDTVRKVTLAGVVTTPYGSPGVSTYNDAFGTASRFSNPQAIVADGEKLYVADDGNSRVRVIDTSTTGVSTLAGNGTGEVEDGVGTGASVYDPYVQGIIGSTLYFGEGFGDVIRSVTVDTKEVTTLAGSVNEGYFNDGSGVGALCSAPDSATTDGEYLYFTQSGNSHVIRKMNLDTLEVSLVAGIHGSSGTADNYQDSQFYGPGGITTDGENLYVADSSNHTIRKIVLATGQVSTFAGSAGTNGSTDGTGSAARFSFPTGITTDGTNLYVTDRNNHTIRKIVISTKVVTTLAGTAGSSDSVDGTGADARFNTPRGITTDGTSLFVADRWNQSIRKIDLATAVVTTFAGSGTAGAVDDVGTDALFNGPYGIACDGTSLYVTEEQNDMVRRIDIETAEVTSVAGHPAHTDTWADGTYMDAYFYEPSGAVCDGSNVWIMDRGNHVIRKVQ